MAVYELLWGGGGERLFTCPYPLKVQARPTRDQRLDTQSRISVGFLFGGMHPYTGLCTDIVVYKSSVMAQRYYSEVTTFLTDWQWFYALVRDKLLQHTPFASSCPC